MIEPLQAALRALAQTHMAQDSAHDLAHLDRVWATCKRIGLAEGGDLRLLLAGAYLHDLVNLPKDHPQRSQASQLAAEKAAPLLRDLGFDEHEVAAVSHMIAAHSYSAGIPPKTPEASILRDADRLDAIGAVGIARCFAVSGQLNRALYDPADPFCRTRAPDDTRYAIDHFQTKLLRLPKGMLTGEGRQIALERCRLMLDFLDDFAQDIGHPAPDHWRHEALNA